MIEMRFEVEIDAPKERVWNTLWQNETFREWAGIIDPGTRMDGELKEGGQVQFISESGYGVTSLVEKLTLNKHLRLRHKSDTQNNGKAERDHEWTGGSETYSISEKEGRTTLIVSFDVPPHMEEYFNENYPKALERVKILAENK